MAAKGPVSWGILGCGRASDRRVAPVFGRDPDAILAAVCSRSMATARSFAERHGAKRAYDSLDSMLADKGVQAVYVATPNGLHGEHVTRCLAAGKHVLVEKPMAMNGRQAAELVQMAEKAGRHLGVMHQQRFHPANMHLIRLNDEGQLGKLNVLRVLIGMWYPPGENWRGTKEMAGGGVAIDLGPHAVDLMLQLGGEVAAVEAHIAQVQFKTPLEDFCSARLHLKNGAVGLLEVGYCMHDYGGRVEAYGSEATFVAHGSMQHAGAYQTWFRRGGHAEPMTEDRFDDCFLAAIEDFTDSVLHGGEPAISMYDGLRVTRVIDAVYESAARHAAVALA